MPEEQRKALAREALKLARIRIQKNLPVFGGALAVPNEAWTDGRSGMDAQKLYWNEQEVLKWFREGMEVLERQYVHLLFHGIFLHGFRRKKAEERIWWLACDLLAEYRIDRMHVPGFAWPIPACRSRYYREIKEASVPFDERSLCTWLASREEKELEELERIFRKDEHVYWRENEQAVYENHTGQEWKPEETQGVSEAVHRWRTVFEHLELRQEEHRRQAGGSVGTRTEQIVLQKERGYDYRRFLKQFAVEKEERLLDMDSFDYIPYDYSRRMYERLVFLEPLEYKEVRRLQEFVIAIDTSGSCSGEVVRRFLTETWEILQEKENFFRDMRIHLIQCDCLVQEHVCVASEEEWKDYLEHMSVKGHGDTDFTPVFRLVDRLVEEGRLKHLKGLLYFTDGDGIYPDRKPGYETAFVFLNEELRKGTAPSWAQTLTLDAGPGWEKEG